LMLLMTPASAGEGRAIECANVSAVAVPSVSMTAKALDFAANLKPPGVALRMRDSGKPVLMVLLLLSLQPVTSR
jgi:hypothetical protein